MLKLKERTGKSLDDWIKIIERDGPPEERERREWLVKAHGFTTNYAWWVAGEASGNSSRPEHYHPEEMVEKLFSNKENLRPIYDKLLKIGLAVGAEAKACPCETMVPLYRNHVFAQIKPTTKTRIDMGFALGALPPTGRLVSTLGYETKDRITHRIPITSLDEVDAEVHKWMKIAYDGDAAE